MNAGSVPVTIPRPNRAVYLNDKENYAWLGSMVKAARWLGLVGFDQIVDERNAEPIRVHEDEHEPDWEIRSARVGL